MPALGGPFQFFFFLNETVVAALPRLAPVWVSQRCARVNASARRAPVDSEMRTRVDQIRPIDQIASGDTRGTREALPH